MFDADDLLMDPEIADGEMIEDIRSNALAGTQASDHFARLRCTMLAADYCTAPTEELAANIRRFFRPAMVLPDGFDRSAYKLSRRAVRRRRWQKPVVSFALVLPEGRVRIKAISRSLRRL